MPTIAILYFLLIGAVVLILVRMRNRTNRHKVYNSLSRKLAWMRANVQELVGIPVALTVFWLSGIFLRWLEPSSAIYDAGVLQGITIVLVHLLVGNSIAKFGTKLNLEWFYKGQTVTTFDRQCLYVIYLAAYCVLAASL
ncbi:MAG: hypothetical protein ABI432_08600 [Flavobacteriales bacterium]